MSKAAVKSKLITVVDVQPSYEIRRKRWYLPRFVYQMVADDFDKAEFSKNGEVVVTTLKVPHSDLKFVGNDLELNPPSGANEAEIDELLAVLVNPFSSQSWLDIDFAGLKAEAKAKIQRLILGAKQEGIKIGSEDVINHAHHDQYIQDAMKKAAKKLTNGGDK